MNLKALLQGFVNDPTEESRLIVIDALKEEGLVPMEWEFNAPVIKRTKEGLVLCVCHNSTFAHIARVDVDYKYGYQKGMTHFWLCSQHPDFKTLSWDNLNAIRIVDVVCPF